jgi:hypothetical protein
MGKIEPCIIEAGFLLNGETKLLHGFRASAHGVKGNSVQVVRDWGIRM